MGSPAALAVLELWKEPELHRGRNLRAEGASVGRAGSLMIVDLGINDTLFPIGTADTYAVLSDGVDNPLSEENVSALQLNVLRAGVMRQKLSRKCLH